MNKIIFTAVLSIFSFTAFSQEVKKEEPTKHYMPLYLDIPAEMNVRKGYKEANIGFGYADFKDFRGQRALLEYDFAPIDKLGIEIELPFIFVQEKHTIPSTTETHSSEEGGRPKSGNAIRIGFNYALFNDVKSKTSIGIGYFNELEFTPFEHFGKPLFEANIYNPFVAIAKIWSNRLHTMIYTGTATKQDFIHHTTNTSVRFNTIVSYRFGKGEKENFVGIESNQTLASGESGQMTLRPQVQIELSEKWKLGIVGGIPIATNNHLNGSGFLRLIYSPR